MIELKDVQVYYYGEKVFDLNITIPSGRVVILSPSGNGKTTLLRVICGLKEIEDGYVYIDGRDVSLLPPSERNLALVCKETIPSGNVKVVSALEIPLKKRKVCRSERKRKIAELMRLFDINDVRVKELSNSQLSKVVQARISLRQVAAVIIDEPSLLFGGEIMDLSGTENVIIASTDAEDIERYNADYVIVMRRGKVVACGSPSELDGDRFVELFAK